MASTTPAVDAARLRARLTTAHLDVLAHLLTGARPSPGSDDALDELVRADLVVDGVPSPFLRELVTELTQARVSIDVEIAGRHGLSTHGATLGAGTCWTVQGWPGEPLQEYARLDPRLLPTSLAATLGLSLAAGEAQAQEIATTLGTLDLALTARGEAEGRAQAEPDLATRTAAVRDAIAAVGDVDPVLADVLAHERRSWRMTTSWREGESLAVRALAVLDSDEQGLWERVLPAEPVPAEPLPPTEPVLLRRLSAADAFRAVGALLPRTGEGR